MEARKQYVVEPIEQYSAGGAAFRETNGNFEVAVILTVPERRWQLPKGIVDPGETTEQAALREVNEEAGIITEIIEPIKTTDYWFSFEIDGRSRRIHKFVDFFLMRYLGGDVADHDHEVEEARWVGVEKALAMLEFQQERDVVAEGFAKIKKLRK